MRCVFALVACAACSTPSASARDVDPYADHIAALKKQLAPKKLGTLQYLTEKPFVVIGNGTEAQLAVDADTVKWAVTHLEKDFFAVRPSKILDVYLFRDAKSYERGVRKLTGESPSTPYGFYSESAGGLFMNIATGGGTLVHEIVHPYVEADFPNAPPWLNEGLGSLFEQSAEREGHIVGLTNWRLEGLKKAIAADSVPTFDKLTSLSATEFYGDDAGVNYAASRYLLYYLQQKGTLVDFYKTCRASRDKDPTCIASLKKALATNDLDAFETDWEKYVLTLTFP